MIVNSNISCVSNTDSEQESLFSGIADFLVAALRFGEKENLFDSQDSTGATLLVSIDNPLIGELGTGKLSRLKCFSRCFTAGEAGTDILWDGGPHEAEAD